MGLGEGRSGVRGGEEWGQGRGGVGSGEEWGQGRGGVGLGEGRSGVRGGEGRSGVRDSPTTLSMYLSFIYLSIHQYKFVSNSTSASIRYTAIDTWYS